MNAPQSRFAKPKATEMTDAQKNRIIDAWLDGASMSEVGRLFGVSKDAVSAILKERGYKKNDNAWLRL